MCLVFREGKKTTEDEPRLGLPSTSKTPEMIEKVRQMLAQEGGYERCMFAELNAIKDLETAVL